MAFKRQLSIAISASLVSDTPHLREKTAKIGMVGRAAAIFGVDGIIIYPDVLRKDQNREIDLMAMILSYMETPQYLRKLLFKLRPELRYVGVLPPLRTPHHPLPNRVKDLVDGEYREAATVSHTKNGTLIDVGVEQNALVQGKKIPLNTRITAKIRKTTRQLEAEVVNRSEIGQYWGYRVVSPNLSLGKLLRKHAYDLVIVTSKHGKPFPEISEKLVGKWKSSSKILIAFGAPTQGLYEIVEQEGLNLDKIADFVVNVIPNQWAETVRTEEALYITLGILNVMVAKG